MNANAVNSRVNQRNVTNEYDNIGKVVAHKLQLLDLLGSSKGSVKRLNRWLVISDNIINKKLQEDNTSHDALRQYYNTHPEAILLGHDPRSRLHNLRFQHRVEVSRFQPRVETSRIHPRVETSRVQPRVETSRFQPRALPTGTSADLPITNSRNSQRLLTGLPAYNPGSSTAGVLRRRGLLASKRRTAFHPSNQKRRCTNSPSSDSQSQQFNFLLPPRNTTGQSVENVPSSSYSPQIYQSNPQSQQLNALLPPSNAAGQSVERASLSSYSPQIFQSNPQSPQPNALLPPSNAAGQSVERASLSSYSPQIFQSNPQSPQPNALLPPSNAAGQSEENASSPLYCPQTYHLATFPTLSTIPSFPGSGYVPNFNIAPSVSGSGKETLKLTKSGEYLCDLLHPSPSPSSDPESVISDSPTSNIPNESSTDSTSVPQEALGDKHINILVTPANYSRSDKTVVEDTNSINPETKTPDKPNSITFKRNRMYDIIVKERKNKENESENDLRDCPVIDDDTPEEETNTLYSSLDIPYDEQPESVTLNPKGYFHIIISENGKEKSNLNIFEDTAYTSDEGTLDNDSNEESVDEESVDEESVDEESVDEESDYEDDTNNSVGAFQDYLNKHYSRNFEDSGSKGVTESESEEEIEEEGDDDDDDDDATERTLPNNPPNENSSRERFIEELPNSFHWQSLYNNAKTPTKQ